MIDKCFDEGTLQAFLDNELSQDLSQAVARHLVDCDPCAILLSEVEEETAFAFAALEQEFNTLVPTQRLWTKINESIEVQHRKRGFWQRLLGAFSGFSFTNPHVIAFGSLLLIVGVVSVLIVTKNNQIDTRIAKNEPPVAPQSTSKTTVPQPVVSTDGEEEDTKDIPPANDTVVKPMRERVPQVTVEKASFVETKQKRQTAVRDIVDPVPQAPQVIAGEESYVNTIATLEKTVNQNKDEVLKPSARFSYEKDLAVVNDTIDKMRAKVKKNPKNEDAKQVLFASYQNKIELLNSVTQRGELMASLSR